MAGKAIGFRVHSGWAAMVVVSGSPRAPEILERRRIEIMDRSIPGSKQPYHYAAELSIAQAQSHLARCAKRSREMAAEAIEDAIRRHHPSIGGMGISSGRPAGTLEATLASHAAIHSAEGEFFREAITQALEVCELPCRNFKEKELVKLAAEAFQLPDLETRLTEMRKIFGSPWTQDEKFGALAAWLAIKS
jgi:hypothetical protein